MRWLVLLTLAGCSVVDAAPIVPEPVAPFATAPVEAIAPFANASAAPPRLDEAPASAPRDTVLWVGGDVLDGEALRDFARTFDEPADGFAAILAPAAELWKREDAFVLVNLEVPIADTRRVAHGGSSAPAPGRLRRVHLQGAPWMCEGLARVGVDAVMLANNHALDQGHEGLAETIRCAHRAGMVVSGAGTHPARHGPLVLGDEGRELAVHTLYTGLDRSPPLDRVASSRLRRRSAEIPSKRAPRRSGGDCRKFVVAKARGDDYSSLNLRGDICLLAIASTV